MRVLVKDPAGGKRNGWHDLYGTAEDALAGNISRVFLCGVPQSVKTTDTYQPDDWSCGPYALAECLGQSSGEDARSWLLARGLITSTYGTEYSGIVGYMGACGRACWYDGKAHDGEMSGAIFDSIESYLKKGYKVILCMHGTKKGCRNNYWTYGGHYICVYGIEGGGSLKIDGQWGKKTTKAAQKVLNTTQDGIISDQNVIMKPYLQTCEESTWQFVKKPTHGSELVRAIQRLIGAKVDGFFGMQTIGRFQAFLGVKVDEYVGAETVRAWQVWLNAHGA